MRERERTVSWWYYSALHRPQSKAEDAIGERRADLSLEHFSLFEDSLLHVLVESIVSNCDCRCSWRKTRSTAGSRSRHDVSMMAAQPHRATTALARLLLLHRDAVSWHLKRGELLTDSHGGQIGRVLDPPSSLLNVQRTTWFPGNVPPSRSDGSGLRSACDATDFFVMARRYLLSKVHIN